MMLKNKEKIILIKDTSSLNRTRDFYELFLGRLRKEGLDKSLQIVRAADVGIYNQGLVVKVYPGNITYTGVKDSDISDIIQLTLKKNKVISSLEYKKKYKQLKVVLRNCGVIDPESIEDYLRFSGYQGLKKVILKMSPFQAIEELKISGLRGRGGGGFPTWMKWNFAAKTQAREKFIICNADEGDPGAYMDRSILEGDPHSVLEGMIIAGFIVGAKKGFFYIRAEYPLAIKRVQKAIEQARQLGVLGDNILGSEFCFDLEIRLGAGAFVCGEETALIASIEGRRGYPSPRPPYPSVKGLWGYPTVINNVETLANVPVIFTKGGKWFSSVGSPTSKGTKVFALTGKVKNSGLVEVPMGTTLREIVYDIGGGVTDSRNIKAVQTGGPSGGVIPADFLDTPVDYENLQKLNSIMGSGGMIVIDQDDCVVDIAKFYMRFCVDESCGKCSPCRIGTTQMLGYLRKISKGQADRQDLERLKSICVAVQKASLCGLGQTAANPVLSTLNYFYGEYLKHIEDRECPAGKCLDLLTYSIDPEKCTGCGLCALNCPVKAIEKNQKKKFVIDVNKCIKCGKCFEVCKFEAIKKE
jgi:NADH:ubiquinone oxidoreductase subunit F (NADH-binding)/Pyruvate/2-oxoacid:ferredoxin oxidoreductase delta subunit